MNYLVYEVLSPSGKRYFGLTANFETRIKKHYLDTKSRISKFHTALKKYGDQMTWRIHTQNLSKEEAQELEDDLICGFNTIEYGYNMVRGGGLPPNHSGKPIGLGRKATLKHRAAISKGNMGKPRPKSKEWTEAHSKAMTGRKASEESKRKISTALKGKKTGPISEERRKILSEAHKGIPSPKKGTGIQIHGTKNSYSNYGCRCNKCREAERTYRYNLSVLRNNK